MLGLSSGQTAVLVNQQDRQDSGGMIVTTTADMPELQELLESYQVVFAVLEMPAPQIQLTSGRFTAEVAIAWWRVILAISIGSVISATGWTLLVASVARHKLAVNPYICLSLALGGIVLLATAATSLRSSGSRIE